MILLDASGSMAGSSFKLAIVTIEAILETLSDDDFVNVVVFSEATRSVVPCFGDKLVSDWATTKREMVFIDYICHSQIQQVRGTPDNKKEIMAAVKAVKCENVANFTAGLEYGFELLHRVR